MELGLDQNIPVLSANRAPFDDTMCDLVIEFHPEVVSFHFGLPEEKLVLRVRDTGAKVVSSATSVDEARWLEDRGCDAIIAQGYEAGGHRGIFLTQDVSTQAGTMALVPQVVDAVKVPVIAAGGYRRRAWHFGGFCSWSGGGADRNGLLAVPGGQDQSGISGGAEKCHGQSDHAH